MKKQSALVENKNRELETLPASTDIGKPTPSMWQVINFAREYHFIYPSDIAIHSSDKTGLKVRTINLMVNRGWLEFDNEGFWDLSNPAYKYLKSIGYLPENW